MNVDATERVCPICSYEFPRPTPWLQWVAVLLVVVMFLILVLI